MINNQIERRSEFLWRVHQYTNEYIRFADGKAAVVVAWATALLGAMCSADVPNKALAANASTILHLVAGTAFVGLAGAIVLAVLAVLPRLRRVTQQAWWPWRKHGNTDREGYIFWGDIGQFTDAGVFTDAVHKLSPQREEQELAHHLYVLSNIARTKYLIVNCSILAALIGSAGAVMSFVLAR